MKKIILLGLLIGLVVAVVVFKQQVRSPHNEQVSISNQEISYVVEGQPVTLIGGVSEVAAAPGSSMKIVTKYFGNEVRADVNADGMEDAVFVITQNPGGTGTFYYVVAALKMNTGYRGTNAIFLGDRIAPQTTEFRDGQIVVSYADRKAGEPFSVEPSVGISKYFTVQDGKLIESAR